jgi:hypothetical protein
MTSNVSTKSVLIRSFFNRFADQFREFNHALVKRSGMAEVQ